MSAYGIGNEVLAGWKIVRFIDEGAYGRVYEVQKPGIGFTARSALKIVSVPRSESESGSMLAEGMDQASVAGYFRGIVDEFAREVALASSLNHPGVVAYQDHDIVAHDDGVGWDVLLRMELLEPLTVRMKVGALSAPEVAAVGAQLADALAYCHGRGVIHRDVKPSNVFVDPDGRYKLGDFGVARTAKQTMGALSVKGTPDYMAPEVFRGDPYGPSADVCSLGVMLYQLLNGNRLPFLPPAPAAVGYHDRERAVARRLSGEPVPALAGCDPALAEAVLAACSPDPAARPSSGELHSLLGGLVLPDNGAKLQADEQEFARSEGVFETQERADSETIGVWAAFEAAGGEGAPKEEEEREAELKAVEALHYAQRSHRYDPSIDIAKKEERRREEEELKRQEEANRKAAEAEEARRRQEEERRRKAEEKRKSGSEEEHKKRWKRYNRYSNASIALIFVGILGALVTYAAFVLGGFVLGVPALCGTIAIYVWARKLEKRADQQLSSDKEKSTKQ